MNYIVIIKFIFFLCNKKENEKNQKVQPDGLNINDCPTVNTSTNRELLQKQKSFQAQNKSINDIGLLFYKINDYKITKFLVTKLDEENEFSEPEIKISGSNMISSIIYAATGAL